MLRTAIVEAQAVERGVHPNITLDMGDFRYIKRGKICGCLGGVYAMMGRGLKPLKRWAGMHSDSGITPEERALDALRKGYVDDACDDLGLDPLPSGVERKFHYLICGAYDHGDGRADWDTYLLASDILERA
jgi:hypothetical protein